MTTVPVSFSDAVENLYRIAVEEGKPQSPLRLNTLAEFCIQELEKRGVCGVETEVQIPGAGRAKQWDIGWKHGGKYRLGISLKSILKNIPGTVPNRLDDLMGEVANAQLYSPEIVIGYIMLFDVGQDVYSAKHGSRWLELLQKRVSSLSGRRPPSWTPGTIESHVIAEIDFTEGCRTLSNPSVFDDFFECLVNQIHHRNPGVISKLDNETR